MRAAAVVMVAGLVSVGCGSRVGDSGTSGSSASSCVDASGGSVKVGFLNSLSGTMAISEKTVHDSLMLAAEQNARVLLLDEPVAGMSADERAQTGELLRRIGAERTVVVVAHYERLYGMLDLYEQRGSRSGNGRNIPN